DDDFPNRQHIEPASRGGLNLNGIIPGRLGTCQVAYPASQGISACIQQSKLRNQISTDGRYGDNKMMGCGKFELPIFKNAIIDKAKVRCIPVVEAAVDNHGIQFVNRASVGAYAPQWTQ